MARYVMTPARKAALRKAQKASARKRKGKGKKKPGKLTNGGWVIKNRGRIARKAVKYGAYAAIAGGVGAVVAGGALTGAVSKNMGNSNKRAARDSIRGARGTPKMVYKMGIGGARKLARRR